MNRAELIDQIKKKQSYLCVGLDTDLDKIPKHLLKTPDPVFEFNRAIIDATREYAVAYKPNIAFYEALGPRGWESLQKTIEYVPKNCFTIADAKRGDIASTAEQYAREAFGRYAAHAVTVNPYLGTDAVRPFLARGGVLGLCRHSTPGAAELQSLYVDGPPHDFPDRQERDRARTTDLENLGYTVIRFHHRESWTEIVRRHEGIFGRPRHE